MARAVLNVPDISCAHCESTITKALGGQSGVSSVRVDIPARQVALEYDSATISIEQVKAVLEAEDYPVESASQA